MQGDWIKALPNALTVLRIALSVLVFVLLAAAAGALGAFGAPAPGTGRASLLIASAVIFSLAAITDFFDGWLARRLEATSAWGVILDPIADKIAIAAGILGLTLLEPSGVIAIPGFAILFREMFVSGLRESLAPLGIKLKVTLLAKWKTTVQLTALALEMLAAAGPDASLLRLCAHGLLWLAAVLTLVTGAQYVRGASAALGSARTPPAGRAVDDPVRDPATRVDG